MSSQRLQWIVEFEIKKGKREEFEKVVQDISNLVRRSEPGTRLYEWFIDNEGRRCIVLESYDSSISGVAHAKGEAIKRFFPLLLKLAKISSFKVCGNPDEELIKELADVDAKFFQFAYGFSR
jgi:quinol monooxygenase YgiN